MLVPMAILTLISVACILAGLFVPDLVAGARKRAKAGKAVGGPDAATPVEPATLEGVLVSELISGEITAAQYRRLVEELAARDADRNPLSVPPDLGSADA